MQLVFPADVDECVDAGACGAARCQNLPGSYSCVCDEGYVFSSQEKGCQGTYLRPHGTHRHTQGAMLQGALCRVPPRGAEHLHTRNVAPASPYTRRGPCLTCTHVAPASPAHTWPLPHLHTRDVAPASPAHTWPLPHLHTRGPCLTCTRGPCLTCTHMKWPLPHHACDVAPAAPARVI